MSAVQLLFTRRRHPGSALIRVTTWSAWSHVDLIDGQSVLGAVAFHGVERELLGAELLLQLVALLKLLAPRPQVLAQGGVLGVGAAKVVQFLAL